MKNQKIPALLIALLLAAAVLCGCTGNTAPPSSAAPASTAPESTASAAVPAEGTITATDMMGREITLEAPAEKVVAITAADCEILYALGAGDKLVGRGEYCNWPPEAEALPVVKSGNETNVEQIIALDPDMVLMSSMDQDPEQISQLEGAGITVVVNEAFTIDDVYKSIRLIGAVTGTDANAETMVADMQAGFKALEDSVPADAEAKTIYFEVSPLEYGLWTPGGNTFYNEIATMLGLENIFASEVDYVQVSEEQVIERNPDYIVTITMYFGEGPQPDEEIYSRDGWQNMSAIQNKNVFIANVDELSRPGPRLVDGAQSLYEFVYGK